MKIPRRSNNLKNENGGGFYETYYRLWKIRLIGGIIGGLFMQGIGVFLASALPLTYYSVFATLFMVFGGPAIIVLMLRERRVYSESKRRSRG